MLLIGNSFTLGSIILFLSRDKIFMHMVFYLENYVLSQTIFSFVNKNYFPRSNPFEMYNISNGFKNHSIFTPFSPFSSLILQVPIQNEYFDSDVFTLTERFVLRTFITITGLAILCGFMLLMIRIIKRFWSLFLLTIGYKITAKIMKLLLILLLWF